MLLKNLTVCIEPKSKLGRQDKCLHYNRQILESDNKVKTIWKIVTGEHSTVEENLSVKINNSITKSPELSKNSFNIYFLIFVGKVSDGIKKCNKGGGSTIANKLCSTGT
jgi:hypothetical protein